MSWSLKWFCISVEIYKAGKSPTTEVIFFSKLFYKCCFWAMDCMPNIYPPFPTALGLGGWKSYFMTRCLVVEPSSVPGKDPRSQENKTTQNKQNKTAQNKIKTNKTRKTGRLPTTPTSGNVFLFLCSWALISVRRIFLPRRKELSGIGRQSHEGDTVLASPLINIF